MKTTASLAVLFFLSACAYGNAAIPAGRTQRSNIQFQGSDGTMSVETTHEAGIVSSAFDASPDQAWSLLPKIYEDLGIPLSEIDSDTRVLGAREQRVRRIGGERMSEYLRCGESYGNNADRYDIFATVRTQILAGESGGSVARTEVAALAQAPAFNTRVVCTSTGKLEQRIAEMLQQRLVGSG